MVASIRVLAIHKNQSKDQHYCAVLDVTQKCISVIDPDVGPYFVISRKTYSPNFVSTV